MIDSIEVFIEKYNTVWYWFKDNQCTTEVLEYYIENYDNIRWYSISSYQSLTESFIIKYKDNLFWNNIFHNTNISLTYYFIEDNLYHFNLYKVYKGIRMNRDALGVVSDIFAKLKENYKEKYEIDKLSIELNGI